MKASRELLEGQLERYEQQLRGLNSYIRELKTMTDKHGTDREHFEGDLAEAEHNVKYYEDEIARIKGEIGKSSGARRTRTGAADAILPRTAKQGIGAFVFSSISFAAGTLLGSRLKSRRGGQGAREEKREGE